MNKKFVALIEEKGQPKWVTSFHKNKYEFLKTIKSEVVYGWKEIKQGEAFSYNKSSSEYFI